MSTVIQQIDLALSCATDEETPAIVVLAEMAAPALVEARAEILRLRAENRRMNALLADIDESLEHIQSRDRVTDPYYDRAVLLFLESLGGRGYGAIMDATSRLWRQRAEVPGGEFIAGPCRATVDRWRKEIAALRSEHEEDGNG